MTVTAPDKAFPLPSTSYPGGLAYVPRAGTLYDVMELILDRGMVIDVFLRVSLVGIEILRVDARVVVASVDTYLRFAEACNRLDLETDRSSTTVPELLGGGMAKSAAKSAGKGKLKSAAQSAGSTVRKALGGADDEEDDGNGDDGPEQEEQEQEEPQEQERRPRKRVSTAERRKARS
jgi:gas vesicle structural protein